MLSGRAPVKPQSEAADPITGMAAAAPTEIRWLAVDRRTRRRVARSIRKGEPLSSPNEAAIAAGYCVATLVWLSQRDRLRPLLLAAGVVLAVELLLTWTVPAIPLLGAAIGFGWLWLRTGRLRQRLTFALAANRGVAEAADEQPVAVRLPGEGWLQPGRRRRRLVSGLSAALAVLTFLGLLATFAYSPNGRWAERADRVCAVERTRLASVEGRGLGELALERRVDIERDALVALGRLDRRTSLADEFLDWRRYEVELDAWLAAAVGDPRVPAERAKRRQALERSRELASRLGASVCARV
jgi:hypothetical protein